MNQTSTTATFSPIDLLDPATRAYHRLAWLSTVDHKRIAVLYMITGLFFFVVGGLEAFFIRLQLALPNNNFLHPDTFNQLFTNKASTIIAKHEKAWTSLRPKAEKRKGAIHNMSRA
jgi:hypothetical protein